MKNSRLYGKKFVSVPLCCSLGSAVGSVSRTSRAFLGSGYVIAGCCFPTRWRGLILKTLSQNVSPFQHVCVRGAAAGLTSCQSNTCTQWMGIEKCTHTYQATDSGAFTCTRSLKIKFSEIPKSQQVCRLNPDKMLGLQVGVCIWGLNILKGQKKQRLVYHSAVTFHIF